MIGFIGVCRNLGGLGGLGFWQKGFLGSEGVYGVYRVYSLRIRGLGLSDHLDFQVSYPSFSTAPRRTLQAFRDTGNISFRDMGNISLKWGNPLEALRV